VNWPSVIYSEEIVREGFGIADARIPLSARVELIEALSGTGLKRISVGAFVSARYVPQMAGFEELLRSFRPTPGVAYLTFAHTAKARAIAARFAPPLTLEDEMCTLFIDICDVHQRRNVNRSIEQGMQAWAEAIEDARSRGIDKARVAIYSAWGSNFLGKFSRDYRLSMLARQIDLLEASGLDVVEIGLHDSQSWCLPQEMEQDLREIKRRWPAVRRFHLHMHDARAMALPSLYAALRTLEPSDTVLVDGTLGGLGGGQYCGNGMASAMVASEDFLHMLEGMGIQTGVDLDKLIECVWMLERLLGVTAFGHVSKAGPRPGPGQLYDPNLPAVESLAAARHFKLGPAAYEGEAYSPWKHPIAGPWFHQPDAQDPN
jgi:hydroxymethylglutaryl-CoA lyase